MLRRAARQEGESRFGFRAMGSPCEIRVFGPSPEANERAAAQASGEIERLERKYTRFRDDSLTSQINASAGDPRGTLVDDETAALLDYA